MGGQGARWGVPAEVREVLGDTARRPWCSRSLALLGFQNPLACLCAEEQAYTCAYLEHTILQTNDSSFLGGGGGGTEQGDSFNLCCCFSYYIFLFVWVWIFGFVLSF